MPHKYYESTIAALNETIIFKDRIIALLEAKNYKLEKENAKLKSTNKSKFAA